MQSYSSLCQQVENYLIQLQLPQQPAQLYNPITHILSIGGKRIRPCALLMAHEVFAPLTNASMHAAIAVELFHNFTLVHDDIMDNAPLRRGKATVHEAWSTPVAILSGDALNILAYQELCKTNSNALPKLLSIFNKTALEVCEGQQLDMDFEACGNTSIADYVHMITLKTSVLLAASMQMGAVLAGASDSDSALMYSFGKNLGISFQLKDDYLDAFGNTEQTGKQVGGDILAGKKTYLHLRAIEKASAAQQQEMLQMQALPQQERIAAVLAMWRLLDVHTDIVKEKQYYSQLAMRALAQVNASAEQKVVLTQLAEYLLEREH